MDSLNSADHGSTRSDAVRDVPIFLCYRRRDGEWCAEWLYERLRGHEYIDRDGHACRIRVYFDKTAPGVGDWKALHFPSLQTAHALVVISTTGIAKDFTRRGEPDWVYEELRWWVRSRKAPPIVIDTTGEGTRWFPDLIVTKWPDLNWIALDRDEALRAPDAVGGRVRDRIVGAIQELEHQTLFEELERSRHQERRLRFALGAALVLFAAAALLGLFAFNQRLIAVDQKNVAISRALSIQSGKQLASDPELGVLLAIEAERASATRDAESALRRSLVATHIRLVLRGHESGLSDAVFSPDGKSILTGGWDKSARVWNGTTGSLILDLRGHRGEVRKPRFSPDGRLIVTASSDRTARVWDTATGKLLADFRGHTDQLNSASFSPDGKRIVTASLDKTARIWDVATSRQVAELRGGETIQVAKFSPDGQTVLTASMDGTARLWEADTGALRHHLRGHREDLNTGGLEDAAFSPDGTLVVTASRDHTARVWSVATGKQLVVLSHPALVSSVAFSPDGSRIATACWDRTVRMWITTTGRMLREFRGDTDIVSKVAFSPNGRWLLSTADTSMQIWSADSGELVATMPGHSGQINGASFSPNGNRVVTASSDGTARVWDTAAWEPEFELTAPQSTTLSARFSPDGRYVITANSDGNAHVWRSADGTHVAKLAHEGIFNAVFSHDGRLIATTSVNETTHLWQTHSWELVRTLETPAAILHSLIFSPDTRLVAAAAANKTAMIWDVGSGKLLHTLRGNQDNLTDVTFSPDGRYVVTCGLVPDNARVWDAQSGREVADLRDQRVFGSHVSVSPDSKYVLTAGDRTARLWDIVTGKRVRDMEGHTEQLVTAVFSPHGDRIVTTSFDNTARLFNAATAELIAVLRGHAGRLTGGVFSGDGRWVATSGNDGTARIWDSTSGEPLSVFRGHSGEIASIEYNPDGTQLLTTGEDHAVFLYRCSECQPVGELHRLAASRVTRQLTGTERSAFGLPVAEVRTARTSLGVVARTSTKTLRVEKVELQNRVWVDDLISFNEEHLYTIQGKHGQEIAVITRTPSDSKLDPHLTLRDPNGKILAEDDDGAPSDMPGIQPWDALIVQTLPETGRYTIVLKGMNSDFGRCSIMAVMR